MNSLKCHFFCRFGFVFLTLAKFSGPCLLLRPTYYTVFSLSRPHTLLLAISPSLFSVFLPLSSLLSPLIGIFYLELVLSTSTRMNFIDILNHRARLCIMKIRVKSILYYVTVLQVITGRSVGF